MCEIWIFVIGVLFQQKISAHENQVDWKKRMPIHADLAFLNE